LERSCRSEQIVFLTTRFIYKKILYGTVIIMNKTLRHILIIAIAVMLIISMLVVFSSAQDDGEEGEEEDSGCGSCDSCEGCNSCSGDDDDSDDSSDQE
jgi:hypothetical protein